MCPHGRADVCEVLQRYLPQADNGLDQRWSLSDALENAELLRHTEPLVGVGLKSESKSRIKICLCVYGTVPYPVR